MTLSLKEQVRIIRETRGRQTISAPQTEYLTDIVLDQDTRIKELEEALESIAYCKTWTVNNRPRELVSIALAALSKHKGD
jgi:hypothetical protein